MNFDPRNILVIDFGRMGDVVLSLPALGALRAKFPQARITVAVGRTAAPIIELAGVSDETLAIDHVAWRGVPKPLALLRIAQLVKQVRARKFDFVVDLHSLPETNLLGFLSGAAPRLYQRRPHSSLDLMAHFSPRPPLEDLSKHAIDRYLDVLTPLEVGKVSRTPRLQPRAEDERVVEAWLKKEKVGREAPMVGMFPGGGDPSRRWPLERFAELARAFESREGVRVALFAGPEERSMVREMRAQFPRATIIFDQLTLAQLAAAAAHLAVFVSHDTGPMQIAAAVGTPVVTLLADPQHNHLPPGQRHQVLHRHTILEITIDEVYAATRAAFTTERMASLFSS